MKTRHDYHKNHQMVIDAINKVCAETGRPYATRAEIGKYMPPGWFGHNTLTTMVKNDDLRRADLCGNVAKFTVGRTEPSKWITKPWTTKALS